MIDEPKGKGKPAPLPSILSSIRNAGRAQIYQQQQEVQPLMIDTESHSQSQSPSFLRRNKSMTRIFERVQSMQLFENNKKRFRKLRSRNFNRNRGFKVDLPPKFLLYTIFVFIILPLLLGAFFLVRTVLSGELKEDEEHPLHKKHPHFRARNHTSSAHMGNFKNESATNVDMDENATLSEVGTPGEHTSLNGTHIVVNSNSTTSENEMQKDLGLTPKKEGEALEFGKVDENTSTDERDEN